MYLRTLETMFSYGGVGKLLLGARAALWGCTARIRKDARLPRCAIGGEDCDNKHVLSLIKHVWRKGTSQDARCQHASALTTGEACRSP